MNIIETKDEDATLQPDEEDDEEEDYTVKSNVTLRVSACYSLKMFAELYPEITF